jgi:hypothetical protein
MYSRHIPSLPPTCEEMNMFGLTTFLTCTASFLYSLCYIHLLYSRKKIYIYIYLNSKWPICVDTPVWKLCDSLNVTITRYPELDRLGSNIILQLEVEVPLEGEFPIFLHHLLDYGLSPTLAQGYSTERCHKIHC